MVAVIEYAQLGASAYASGGSGNTSADWLRLENTPPSIGELISLADAGVQSINVGFTNLNTTMQNGGAASDVARRDAA